MQAGELGRVSCEFDFFGLKSLSEAIAFICYASRVKTELLKFSMDIRKNIIESHDRVWDELAKPGAVLSGGERIAVAQEIRASRTCRFCIENKRSLGLSPGLGEHESTDPSFPKARLELIHRLMNDPGRISRAWVENLRFEGVGDVEYVEIAGLVSSVCVVDTFCQALGLTLRQLPKAISSENNYKRPATAEDEGAYVPMIAVDRLQVDYSDLYDLNHWVPNVHRAFSLIPDVVRLADDLMASHYFPYESVPRYADQNHDYAISKTQMELIASRVSINNDCFY